MIRSLNWKPNFKSEQEERNEVKTNSKRTLNTNREAAKPVGAMGLVIAN